jgi:hypothetical protein
MLEELLPLVSKVKVLEGNQDADDIYQIIVKKAQEPTTTSMAKSACEYTQIMTHPKAWGDRNQTGYQDLMSWCDFLSKLSLVSLKC